MAAPTVLEADTFVSSKKSKDRHLRKRDYDRDDESEEDYDVREPDRAHEKKKSRSRKDKGERDRDRDRDRDKDKGRDGDGERERGRGKDRDKDKGRDRDGEKVRESKERHRDKEKHKEERAREKEKLREEREREKEKLRLTKERQREQKERQREEKEKLREEKEKLKEEKEQREREKAREKELREEKARLKEEKEVREREKARLKEEKEREKARVKEEKEKERLREEREREKEREKERLREEKEQREKERLREEKEQRERERFREEKEQRERERLREEKEQRERERLREEREQREREKERLRAEKEQQEREQKERELREERERRERELREQLEREKEAQRLRDEEREKERIRVELEREKKEKEEREREKEKLREERERERRLEKEKLKEERSREKDKIREERERERERELDTDEPGRGDRGRDREKKDKDRHREERDRDRAKDRDKDKHADRDREKVKDKEKDKEKKRRDREKERERQKDRERERDEDDDRDRDRKRRKREEVGDHKDRERDRQKDRDRTEEDGPEKDRKRKRREDEAEKGEGKPKKDVEEEDADEEQRKLDEEMEKRRRRVQEWQELRRRKEEEERKKRGDAEEVVEPDNNAKKAWTLEGEESDDEDLPKGEDTMKIDGDVDSKVASQENGDLVMAEADAAAGTVAAAVGQTGVAQDAVPSPQNAEMQGKAGNDGEPAGDAKSMEEQEDEIDPLDAFMNAMVIPEVEKLNNMESSLPEVPKPEKEPVRILKDRRVADTGRYSKKNPRNVTGRIIPGEDSASEDEREEGEGAVGDEEDDDFLKRVKKTKADKLAPVDHSKIHYPSFRKNFYIEVKEIARMEQEEVAASRKELELKIRGKDVPRAVKTWNQTGLSSKVLDVIKKLGFEKPMPIQAQALPIIMSGRDCIGIAKTGSGKTLAFVLPMLRHIMDQPPLVQGDGPIGLIMAPTRELVQQIYNDIKRFSKVLGLSCVPVYGGSGVAQQISDLKRGTEIVVCTPGRMIDILCTSAGKITNLRRVTYFVMDEADRMFDMGFEPQITRIVQNTRPDRQTVLFSATFPRQVEVLARKVLTKPIEIQVGGRSVVNRDITQTVEVRPDSERFLRMLELLGEWYEKGKILIFVHSQEKCDSLFRDLLKAGYPCLSLHGAKDQTDRESTIADFKTNVCNLMIATSVAARGLDVKELELVVNYDVPNHYEDYVHRVGRTGRAGRKGVAVTFISVDEERYAPDLVKALELSEQPVPDDLKKLADDFMAKVSQGTEQAHGSGYGGSGFKFNEEEDEALKAAKKAQAKEYGFEEDEDKSDSDSDDGSIRKQGGDLSEAAAQAAQAAAMAAATKAVQPSTTNPQFQAALLAAQAAASRSLQANSLPGMMSGIPGLTGLTSVAGMNMAGMMGGLVGMQGLAGMTAMTSLGLTGFPNGMGVPNPSASAMGDGAARAAAYAAALNLQHNLAKIQADAMTEHYEAELEINDFPQHARWKVTHKDALGQISEWTGAAITTRGQYFPTGKNPAPGERKLFLFIEGPTEASVKKAKAEIKRILEESTSAAISLPGSTQPGKYSVL